MSFVFLSGILWGTIGIFENELNYLGASSSLASFLRMFFAFVIMSLAAFMKIGKKIFVKDKKVLFICAMFGIICNGIFNIFYSGSIRLNGMAVASVLMYTAPVFTALFSKFLYHENFSRYKILSLFLNILGCTLTVTGGNFFNNSEISIEGIIYGLGSGLCYGMAPIIGKDAGEKTDAFTVSVYSYLFAAIFLMIFTRPEYNFIFHDKRILIIGFLYGLIPTSLAYLAYYFGLKKVSDLSKVPIIASVEPVTAILIGSIIYHEHIGIINFVGICLVLLAIILAIKN